jgi:hypothetical protein
MMLRCTSPWIGHSARMYCSSAAVKAGRDDWTARSATAGTTGGAACR